MSKTKMGKYDLPEELKLIMELNKEYAEKNPEDYRTDFGILGMGVGPSRDRYDITPLDVIPFGWTGCDGIHFGFLTDFGTCKSLSEAYIVCISPMDFDSPVHIVARNISDLLCMYHTTYDLILLNYTRCYSSKEAWLARSDQEGVDPYYERFAPYIERIMKYLNKKPIVDVYDYQQQLYEQRRKEVIVPTLDSLGVVKYFGQGTISPLPHIEKYKYDIHEIRQFFLEASVESKLALIRDLQYYYLLSNNSFELKGLIYEFLIGELDLQYEAGIMIDYFR